MKKTIVIPAIIAFMTGAIFTGCQSSARKVEAAQENVKEAKENVIIAKQELNQALKDSVQQFRIESAEKISYFEKSIADLKAKKAYTNKENKALYEKNIAQLEQKIKDIKLKLDNYKDEGQDNWTAFKHEFNHDMDELGAAFKDLTVKNVN